MIQAGNGNTLNGKKKLLGEYYLDCVKYRQIMENFMQSQGRLADQDIEISQKIIRPKIRAYLEAIKAPAELVETFKRGYCNALAVMAIYGQYLDSLDVKWRVRTDSWRWFESTLKKLAVWDGRLESLNAEDKSDFDHLIAQIEFIQHISHYLQVNQGDLHNIIEDSGGRKLQQEYTLAGLFKAEDFSKRIRISRNGRKINTTLFEQLTQYDRRLILISCGKHTLGLFKHDGLISLYNANHRAGRQLFRLDQIPALIDAIFRAYKSASSTASPFGFRIFTFDQPGEYPAREELLAQVDGPLSSPSSRDARVHSALHIAARIGCVDSLRYYLARTDDIDYQPNKSRTALYIAAGKGRFEAVKLLLERGADIHKPCRENKTPLERAREKGHAHIHDFMRDHAKFNNMFRFFRTGTDSGTNRDNSLPACPLRHKLL